MAAEDLANELSARVQEFWAAFQHGDRGKALDVYSDAATFFRSDAGYHKDFKKELADHFDEWRKELKIHDFKIVEPHAIRLADQTANLTYKQHFNTQGRFGDKNKPKDSYGFVSSVFVNEGGAWRIAHVHETC